MPIVAINDAEAVIEPFWDPALSELSRWSVSPGEAHVLEVKQGWCWVTYEWTRRPAAGPSLSRERRYPLDCTGDDGLVLSVMAPEGAVVRLIARTDRGSEPSPPAS